MNVLVIDGQGGQLGGQIIKLLKENFPELDIIAVGTNATATATMLKAGARQAATGENSVVVACRKADVIIGPIGIVVADAMLGEVTPQIATAVGQADAIRMLLPVNKCDNIIVGMSEISVTDVLQDMLVKVKNIVELNVRL